MTRRWMVTVATCVAFLAATATATAGAAAARPRPALTVGGTVAAPMTYSRAALAALPQTSFRLGRLSGQQTATGVSLETLVQDSQPLLPDAKDAQLRVAVDVTGHGWLGAVPRAFALGELDPGFGDHPAYVALAVAGRPLPAPALVVPGDTVPLRTVPDVSRVDVDVADAAPSAPPSPGALTVHDGARTVVLSAERLAALASRTLSVSFEAGTGSETYTEAGPTLAAVLRAAHAPTGPGSWIAAIGSDGYTATVTPGEALVGGKRLLVSLREDGQPLTQPRLVVDGDVKGGRYVSGVDDLVVGGRTWR